MVSSHKYSVMLLYTLTQLDFMALQNKYEEFYGTKKLCDIQINLLQNSIQFFIQIYYININ